MSFTASTSGRACMSGWDRPPAVADLLDMLLALKRTAAKAGGPVIFILFFPEAVAAPAGFLLNCLQGILPALLDCCEHLALVVEGTGTARDSLRAVFRTADHGSTKRAQPRFFESLSAAFAYAQSFAPHDVLELQRQAIRQSYPPKGIR